MADKLKAFFLPKYGVSVRAENLEQAVEKAKKKNKSKQPSKKQKEK